MSLSVVFWRKTKWSCAIAVLTVAGSLNLQAQTNWEFVSGSTEVNTSGVYTGSDQHPGAREGAVSWTGADGTFWLFGGSGRSPGGVSVTLNDLWKYDVSGEKWELVSGTGDYFNETGNYVDSESAAAHPGSRGGAASWTDGAGDLWMFGGLGYAASEDVAYLNDLWKYDVSAAKWVFLAGVGDYRNQGGNYDNSSGSAYPGSRTMVASWKDNAGDFWIFGGSGYAESDSGWDRLNDLWKFDVSAGKWEFVSGTGDYLNELGDYDDSDDTPAHPGSRSVPISWTDGAGDLWLFGGSGYSLSGQNGDAYNLSDLWRYDIVEEKWVFVAGTADYRNQDANYDNSSGEAHPGPRSLAATWMDDAGNLWMFGGRGTDAERTTYSFNDLWRYDVAEAKWVFVAGTGDYKTQLGNYDNSSGEAHPGSRYDVATWVDEIGHLWMYGGYGRAESSTGALGDLWKYRVPGRSFATGWTLYE